MANNQHNNELYGIYLSQTQFLALFCALLKLQGTDYFQNNDLVYFITICKKQNSFQRLLNGIHVKQEDCLDFKALDQSISVLKQKKLIHVDIEEQNPTVYISPKMPIKRIIDFNVDYLEEMSNFMKTYQIFNQKEWISQKMASQDNLDIDNAVFTLQKIIKHNK